LSEEKRGKEHKCSSYWKNSFKIKERRMLKQSIDKRIQLAIK
jgi:hypothetical protein